MENNKKPNDQEKAKKPHKVILNNREELSITGVDRVYSANETMISLDIDGTNLVVDGSDMQVAKLDIDAGVIEVEGNINQIKYANGSRGNAKHLIGRIFK